MPCAPDMISAARSDFNLQPNKNTKKAPCLNMTSASRASQVLSAEHAELQGSHEELQPGCISLWLALGVPIHFGILVLHTSAFLGLLYTVWYLFL